MAEDRRNSSRESSAQPSLTAQDFLNEQLRLEADAREALPWSFDHCTKPLGPLKQSIFSCLTCNPPPSDEKELENYIPAGICYSCSISCHGDHQLAELFTKRDFECDCGTTRIQSSTPCTLRLNSETGLKGCVRNEAPRLENKYNQNFRNRFCGCGEIYDPEEEKGIMFQCLGLGACGEDWWHPECLLGIPRTVAVGQKSEVIAGEKENADATTRPARDDTNEDDDEIPLPEGFPGEDDFEAFICYRCVDANPWLKAYAGSPGFLPPVYKLDAPTAPAEPLSDSKGESSTPEQSLNFNKRRYGDETDTSAGQPTSKRLKQEDESETSSTTPTSQHAPPPRLHELLPPNPSTRTFSLFLKEDFRDHLCHCPSCFPHLSTYPQLLSEEETYQPPADSRSPSPNPSSLPRNGGTGTGSVHSGGGNSLYERGEAALNTMDRVKALEGVMIYQHLRDKVKEFLRPYAERGEAVGAEDVREYFARLRGDDQGRSSTAAANGSSVGDDDTEQGDGDNRREQSGY